MQRPTILVFESDLFQCEKLAQSLRSGGYEVRLLDGTNVLQHIETHQPELVILPSRNDNEWHTLALARKIRQCHGKIGLILITRKSSEELAISALRAGVDDYFKQPVYVEELVSAVNHLIAQRFNGSNSKVGSWTNYCGQTDRLIGKCAQMQAIKSSIIKMARTDSTVLITGETGTGKGLVARLIHENSARHGRPFISVNSAAVPDNLLESELFGFERGTFTGATRRQAGKFELAHGGTLLLDEISELSLHAQAKILHALESHQIYRLGGHCPIELNVRILSATNQDPEQLVVEQKFRKDLFYRLNVARLHLPPLRDRREDIPLLVNYYIQQCNRRFGRQVKGWREEAENFLLEYDWPGNVRELKNLVEACFIHLPDADTEVLDLPEIYVRKLREIEHKSLDERERLLCALFTTNWNVSQAATRLKWSRMTVYRKMERYHLVRPKSGDEEMT